LTPQKNNPSLWQKIKRQLWILGCCTAILWGVEAVDRLILGGSLDTLGISPRTGAGLKGIVLAPFLHRDFAHLAANTVPLVVLGWFILLGGIGAFFFVLGLAAVIGGLGTWLLGGAGSVHIGASGVVFGFLGFLLVRGYFEKSSRAIVLSIVAALIYGGFVWGVLPGQEGISWQGHLFGFLGGVAAARLLPVTEPRESHEST